MLLRLALSACSARMASSPLWVSASLSSSYASSPSNMPPSALRLRLAQLLVRVVAVEHALVRVV